MSKFGVKITPSRFEELFYELSGHEPFPWQKRLFFDWLCPQQPKKSRWPRTIVIPTACGKTSLIDLSLLALAAGADCARLRTVFIVDRRVVVDETFDHAMRLKERLEKAMTRYSRSPLRDVARTLADLGGEGKPLVIARLRGGIVHDEDWASSPLQPAVILSTVDQAGSRLLFRSYGVGGPRSWPISAGLLGRDSLLIVDEAHCSNAFCETVTAIEELWQKLAACDVGKPLQVVKMSATLLGEKELTLDAEDKSNEEIRMRTDTPKITELLHIDTGEETWSDARRELINGILNKVYEYLEEMEDGVIGVVVNRVADARAVFEALKLEEDKKLLLIGKARGWERDRLLEEWLPRIKAGSTERPSPPVVVVSTQCIEVGANIDFDALVTEIASLDALRQRFGRLNRLGKSSFSRGAIVATSWQTKKVGDKPKNLDPIYGESLCLTWHWLSSLNKGKKKQACIDMCVSAIDKALSRRESELEKLCKKTERAHILLPAHIDLLSHTSPPPHTEPDISAFLHGTAAASPDVTLVWRRDLVGGEEERWIERVSTQPPATGEGCQVPIWEFKKWLAGQVIDEDTGDAEGVPYEEVNVERGLKVLRWVTSEDSEVISVEDVRPGDVIVLPSSYGGCDRYGWNPNYYGMVEDIGDEVAASYRKPVLRIDTAIMTLEDKRKEGGDYEGIIGKLNDLRKAAEDGETDALVECLRSVAEDEQAPEWLRKVTKRLASGKAPKIVEVSGVFILVGRGRKGEKGEDSFTSGMEVATGVKVRLQDHSAGVKEYAKRFSVLLPKDVRKSVVLAAWLHDVGKADPRFQTLLYGGNELAVDRNNYLAKSSLIARDLRAYTLACKQAGFPKGARHEAWSFAMVSAAKELLRNAGDPELLLHLIMSHNGYARPFFPYFKDPNPPSIGFKLESHTLTRTGNPNLHRVDSGVASRYWRLVRKYGWWGLAYLEAILRLADQRESERESAGR
ncbi:MAG: type I-U CRISPR-associated helicase/endonuclease Cas3 [Candidatus Hadarchaeales archaeon]